MARKFILRKSLFLFQRTSQFSNAVFQQEIPQLCNELLTIRDYLRYATSNFNRFKLSYGQCTTNAYEDAIFLIMDSLYLPVDNIEPYLDAHITIEEKQLILSRINIRITKRLPVAYILNSAYYHGDKYLVTPDCLIPRSFIGEILQNDEYVNNNSKALINPTKIKSILDLCTGSGCLAIFCANKIFFAAECIHAMDISPKCIEITKKNIHSHELDELITPFTGNLFDFSGVRKYDLIVCNPPYVDEISMRKLPPEYQHEPVGALQSGSDGFLLVEQIIKSAAKYLNNGGILICEIGKRRMDLERRMPGLAKKLVWLDTELSQGEVFIARKADLLALT